VSKLLRVVYSLVAFTGSLMLHNIGHGFVVYAQDQTQAIQTYRGAEQDGRQWDRHDEKEKEIDEHIRTTDGRLAEVSDKVSMITGVGATVVALLGILNLLGFIKPQRGETGPSGG
jgi:hypothetical protein